MKKVFSVEKLIECMESIGYSRVTINSSLVNWANKCEGLTEEEMTELGYVTNDEWMIEVDEENEEKTNN